MDENVFAILTRDETKALGSVEPFDCSFFHGTFLSVKMTKNVHEMRAETLVCYRCVAMPGLVKIGRSRKEDMVNASARRTSEATSPSGSNLVAAYRTEVYVELHLQDSEFSNIKQHQN